MFSILYFVLAFLFEIKQSKVKKKTKRQVLWSKLKGMKHKLVEDQTFSSKSSKVTKISPFNIKQMQSIIPKSSVTTASQLLEKKLNKSSSSSSSSSSDNSSSGNSSSESGISVISGNASLVDLLSGDSSEQNSSDGRSGDTKESSSSSSGSTSSAAVSSSDKSDSEVLNLAGNLIKPVEIYGTDISEPRNKKFLKPYRDDVGVYTIGIGNKIGDGSLAAKNKWVKKYGSSISPEFAEKLFDKKLNFHLSRVKEIFGLSFNDLNDGERVSVVGLVLVRQRPSTAKGILFITIEDDTGVANLVIWSRQFERFKRAVMNAKLLGVTGKLQREGEVIHLIAENLQDLTFYLSELPEQNQHQVERNKDTIKSKQTCVSTNTVQSLTNKTSKEKIARVSFNSRDFH